MNTDKIKELAEQAGAEYYGTRNTGELILGTLDFDIEQYTKLIVQECCIMINKRTQHSNPNDCLLVLDIKERFGISKQ
jgi:hypothetical protein